MKQHNPHFLFKFPGQPGIYDFSEVREMHIPKNTRIEVTEIKGPGLSRGIGRMTFAAVVAKFR